MDVAEVNDIIDDINSALAGYDVLQIKYLDPGLGYCGSFEITVGLKEDMDIICDELSGLCSKRCLDLVDWYGGGEGFVIPLYAYWDTLDE